MAIALVGTPTTGSAINGADLTMSLPSGLQENDVVIVESTQCDVSTNGGAVSAGWTRIVNVANGIQTRGQVFRKIMGASPDSSITLSGDDQTTNDSQSATARAYRGVDTTTPEDVTPTTATGTSTNPDPPSAAPNTTDAWAIACAGTRIIDTTGTAAPTGYGNFAQVSSDDNRDATSYSADKSGLTGGVAENPAAFTGVSSAPWWAATVILKPASLTHYTLVADSGTLSLSGQAATLSRTQLVQADQGAFSLTGQVADLRTDKMLTAESGTLTLAGQDVNFAIGIILTADGATYALTGNDAGQIFDYQLAADQGAYTLTGNDADFLRNIPLAAENGAFSLTGQAAQRGYGMVGTSGNYVVTGQDADLRAIRTMEVSQGSYTLTGQDAVLTQSQGVLLAEGATYAMTTFAADLVGRQFFRRRRIVEQGIVFNRITEAPGPRGEIDNDRGVSLGRVIEQ